MSAAGVRPAWAWAANLVLPGAGEVLLGRVWFGPIRAVVWALLVGGSVGHALLRPRSDSFLVAVLLAATAGALYLSAQVSLALRLRAARRLRQGSLRDDMFRAALAAYLEGRLDESEALCRRLLRADPADVEATLHLGAIARRRGDVKAARQHLVRARYLDDDGRWDFEIGRELQALQGSAPAGPAGSRPR